MKKIKILDMSERDMNETDVKHIIIDRDICPGINPITDWDNLFLLHSNIPREFCGNEHDKNYVSPLEEVLDEDGYGTGTFTFRKGVVAFPVAAYIHSGISLSLGNGSHFPDQRWDVTRNAVYMWTDRKRFETVCNTWMTLYDTDTHKWRQAKDFEEFKAYLRKQAEAELKTFQKWIDGQVYGYRIEVPEPYTKTYRDGTVINGVDWGDTCDSCWGFIADKVQDIDIPVDGNCKIFDASGDFVGDEFTVPELVIRHPETGAYLFAEARKKGDGSLDAALWTFDLAKAKVYHNWDAANNADIDGGMKLWNMFDSDTVRSKGIIKDKDEGTSHECER
jgi:hypothetical protein